MFKLGFPIYCFILIWTLQSWAQGQNDLSLSGNKAENKFSAEYRLRLSGADSSDEQSQSKIIDLRADLKTKYLLSDSLNLDIQPTVRLQSGQIQSINGADQPDNKLMLNQAALNFSPVSAFRASAGALNQRDMHTSLLVDSIAFPAARAEGLLNAGNLQTSLAVESAVPTSTSMNTNAKALEATPSLNTASVKVHWKQAKNRFLKIQTGYYVYSPLPSSVAQQSGILGNEVNKLSDANYSFMYEHQGVEASSEFAYPVIKTLDIVGGAEYVMNQKAPSDLNSAYRYMLGGDLHLTKNLDLNLRGSYFFIGPEAAVAYFSTGNFGTNRTGYTTEVAISLKKEAFNIGIKYTDSEVIYTNATQSREKLIMIKLETFYAKM
ncbi:MAG: hypothetical protein ACXVCY_03555 [Pseudobdellovibrionaceae bacterium]